MRYARPVSQYFPIIELHQASGTRADEVMGSKTKFWVVRGRARRRVLWKEARLGTGEDWSEKVAYHIARQLEVPCPRVELAKLGTQRGILSWDFLHHTSSTGEVTRSTLVHGNDVLWGFDNTYPKEVRYDAKRHTIEAVHDALTTILPASDREPSGAVADFFDTFVGYLLLDALIGNTDRHHENWGVELSRQGDRRYARLAPSYDHASSLGRELNDTRRRERMDGSSRATVASYANKAQSAFWALDGSRKLSPLEALAVGARLRPNSFLVWCDRLKAISIKQFASYVQRVPEHLLSPIGKRYTIEFLAHNYQRVVDLRR